MIKCFWLDGETYDQGKVADNVSWFDCTPRGHFVLCRSSRWHTGRITLPVTLDAVESPVVPASVSGARISSDGNMIAWVSQSSDKSELFVTSADTAHTILLFSMSTDGFVSVPAWSPGGTALAYYYGPPESTTQGGFSLMTVDVAVKKERPRQMAPPSLWSRLSPARGDPPVWALDGGHLIFEARYRDDDPPGGFYITDAEGHRRFRSAGGQWSSDGKSLYNVSQARGVSEDRTRTLVSTRIVGGPGDVDDVMAELPGNCTNWRLSRDERKLAYFAKGRLYVADLQTGIVMKLGTCDATSKMQWIEDVRKD
jgi:hypothetical protein